MPHLSEVDRHRALGLLQAGLPISEVSLRMNINRTTIFRLRQRLYETNTVSDRPRSGRPRCTTQRQDRNLVRNHVNNRFLSASASSRQTRRRNNQRISANTVRRRLSTSGLRARRPYIGPILTQRLRHQRTLWIQEHAAWDRIQWRSVVFSDESRFCIDHAHGRLRVWRRSGERYQADCVREHDRPSPVSVSLNISWHSGHHISVKFNLARRGCSYPLVTFLVSKVSMDKGLQKPVLAVKEDKSGVDGLDSGGQVNIKTGGKLEHDDDGHGNFRFIQGFKEDPDLIGLRENIKAFVKTDDEDNDHVNEVSTESNKARDLHGGEKVKIEEHFSDGKGKGRTGQKSIENGRNVQEKLSPNKVSNKPYTTDKPNAIQADWTQTESSEQKNNSSMDNTAKPSNVVGETAEVADASMKDTDNGHLQISPSQTTATGSENGKRQTIDSSIASSEKDIQQMMKQEKAMQTLLDRSLLQLKEWIQIETAEDKTNVSVATQDISSSTQNTKQSVLGDTDFAGEDGRSQTQGVARWVVKTNPKAQTLKEGATSDTKTNDVRPQQQEHGGTVIEMGISSAQANRELEPGATSRLPPEHKPYHLAADIHNKTVQTKSVAGVSQVPALQAINKVEKPSALGDERNLSKPSGPPSDEVNEKGKQPSQVIPPIHAQNIPTGQSQRPKRFSNVPLAWSSQDGVDKTQRRSVGEDTKPLAHGADTTSPEIVQAPASPENKETPTPEGYDIQENNNSNTLFELGYRKFLGKIAIEESKKSKKQNVEEIDIASKKVNTTNNNDSERFTMTSEGEVYVSDSGDETPGGPRIVVTLDQSEMAEASQDDGVDKTQRRSAGEETKPLAHGADTTWPEIVQAPASPENRETPTPEGYDIQKNNNSNTLFELGYRKFLEKIAIEESKKAKKQNVKENDIASKKVNTTNNDDSEQLTMASEGEVHASDGGDETPGGPRIVVTLDQPEMAETSQDGSDYEIRDDVEDDGDYEDWVERLEFRKRRSHAGKKNKEFRHRQAGTHRRRGQHGAGRHIGETMEIFYQKSHEKKRRSTGQGGNSGPSRTSTNHTLLDDADIVFIVKHKEITKDGVKADKILTGGDNRKKTNIINNNNNNNKHNNNKHNNTASRLGEPMRDHFSFFKSLYRIKYGKGKSGSKGKSSRHVPNVGPPGMARNGDNNKDTTTTPAAAMDGPSVKKLTPGTAFPLHPVHAMHPLHAHLHRPPRPVNLVWKHHNETNRHAAAILVFLCLGVILFAVMVLAITKATNNSSEPRRHDSSTALYVNYPHY
ncbi:transposable element Tcb1 transposase [Elysia marginata]|uniref:Transposable element Tcb1 transposase n=1 Tax=Elysia marginata TaxID=1093978 RepID=A0AAV4HN52_9GAST|nr:transposable element Tcb1 transposase [Elysia marginata]